MLLGIEEAVGTRRCHEMIIWLVATSILPTGRLDTTFRGPSVRQSSNLLKAETKWHLITTK